MVLNKKTAALSFVLLSLAFFPTYLFTSSNSTGQQFFFVTYLMLLLCSNFLYFRKEYYYPKKEVLTVFITSAFIIITTLSKLSSLDLGGFVNHFRFVFYSLVLLLTFNLCCRLNINSKSVLSVFYIFLISCVIFTLVHIYKPELVAFINPREAYSFRGISIGGPFVWSYIFAFVILPIFFYFMTLLASEFKFRYAICSFLCLGLILLSQSKAAYLSIFTCYFLFSIIFIYYRLVGYKNVILSSVFIFLIILLIFQNYSHELNTVSTALETLQDGGVDSSTAGRLRQITSVLAILDGTDLSTTFFGVTGETLIIENAYFSYLQDYGLFGLLGLLFFMFALFVISFSNLKNSIVNFKADTKLIALNISFFMMVISIPIFSLGSSPIDANKSSYYLFIYWAIVLAVKKERYYNA
ncbi:hypothetical protein BCT08_23540 [Vibrio splendidus]|nr:hypothetical protein BCT08_23540 [Vibrio splendidus]